MHKTIIAAIIGLGLLFASTAGAASRYQWPGGGDLHASVISNIPLARDSGMQTYLAKRHTALPAEITMQALRETRNAQQSRNWGGYVDIVKSHRSAFRSVNTTFRVPTVNVLQTVDGPAGNMAAQWAGLDGDGSASVEQTGVAEWLESDIAVPHYVGWWEMYPAPMVAFGDVAPGDLMRAEVQWYGPRVPSGFTLQLTDQTQLRSGVRAVKFTNFTPSRVSSEVITELPSSSAGPTALTNYGNVRYSQSGTTTSNAPHSLASSGAYTAHKTILVDSSGNTMAGVSSLTNGGTAFSTPFVSNGKW